MAEVPFEDRHVPRAEMDWERSAWWWYPLTRAIHPAMKMLALVTAFVAMWAAKSGVMLGQWLIQPNWQPAVVPNEDVVFRSILLEWVGQIFAGVMSFQSFGIPELAFATFVTMWLALVFSFFGGVLARRGLVELGQRTVGAWGESLRIVFSRWQSLLWSMGMYLVALTVLLLPAVVLGLIGRLGSVGAAIGGVLLLLCFPLVFGVGRMALSMLVCFPLGVCAITAEKKADAFEGFSRSNAYFFQRPAVAFVCAAVLLLFGMIGEQIVYWTLTLGWTLTQGAYLLGRQDVELDRFVSTGRWLTSELIQAYWFSYFWTGTAALYLVLRKSVDHTEMDELDRWVSVSEQTLPEIPTTPPAADTASDDVKPESATPPASGGNSEN